MNNSNEKRGQLNSHSGIGIVIGGALGIAFGPLIFPDAFILGPGIGITLGLLFESMVDSLGRQPIYSMVGVVMGAALGILGNAFLQAEFLHLAPAFGLAAGLVCGAVIDTRRKKDR